MNAKDVAELRSLIDRVILAPTKAIAKPDVQRLEFLHSTCKHTTNGYLAGKLGEAIGYAKQASGSVRDKEHWTACMEQSWYVFENHIKQESGDEPNSDT